jgi:hypothetical protein
MLDIIKFDIVDQVKVCEAFGIGSENAGRFEHVELWFSERRRMWRVDLCEFDYIGLQNEYEEEEDARAFVQSMLLSGTITRESDLPRASEVVSHIPLPAVVIPDFLK